MGAEKWSTIGGTTEVGFRLDGLDSPGVLLLAPGIEELHAAGDEVAGDPSHFQIVLGGIANTRNPAQNLHRPGNEQRLQPGRSSTRPDAERQPDSQHSDSSG